jgi:hypothetical protein
MATDQSASKHDSKTPQNLVSDWLGHPPLPAFFAPFLWPKHNVGLARKCAQFCAHHQTLPTATEYHDISANPCWTWLL